MIKVTENVIKECADNLMFSLSEEETEHVLDEFTSVLTQAEYLNTIHEADDLEPMTFPYVEHQTYLRDDEPRKPLSVTEALRNSQTRSGSYLRLPRVVGNENDKVDE